MIPAILSVVRLESLRPALATHSLTSLFRVQLLRSTQQHEYTDL